MKNFTIHDHLNVVRHKNGIKLVEHSSTTEHTVGRLKQLPHSVYFLNTQGETLTINDEGITVCGFGSLESSIGKSLNAVSQTNSAKQLIDNCAEVIQKQNLKIFEEENIRKDDVRMQFLSIKLPWYDDNDNVIGIMGFSIVLGKHSLAESLSNIIELGLFDSSALPTSQQPSKSNLHVNNVYLTNRELECLRLTVKGYTAKKIARELGLSFRTVEEYLNNVRSKMGASSKSELIEMTIDNFLHDVF